MAMNEETMKRGLRSIIISALGCPGGDPDHCHREAAAMAVVLLRRMGDDSPHAEGINCDWFDIDFVAEAEKSLGPDDLDT
jgi:hypothetical protein